MLIIANKSNKNIVISDLKLVIKKKQVLDLDKLNLHISPKSSKDLRILLSNGSLIQMNRSKIDTDSNKTADVPKNVNSDILVEMKKIIRSEISKQKPKNIVADNTNVIKAIQHLTNLVGKSSVSSGEKEKTEENYNIDVDIDEDKLVEIHAKKIERIAGLTERYVEYVEEESDNASVIDNVEELENML